MRKKSRKILLILVGSLLGMCLLASGSLLLSNRKLPTDSVVLDHLSDSQKAYLLEAIHLRQSLGEQIWNGWGEAEIPLIVYNEAYAFLIVYPDPPPGWMKVPDREPRGAAWEPVPGDSFDGETYYRQALPDPHTTPEAFTVLVGERWVASLPTREFMEISFYQGFRQDLPAFLQAVFPYRLVWNMLMGTADLYVLALNHETFHAYQGMTNFERLAGAEQLNDLEAQYPFGDEAYEAAWKADIELALSALRAESNEQALILTQQFWQARNQHRSELNFSSDLIKLEREREWLEGLAKYAELALGRLAGASASYTPVPEIMADPDFKTYANLERFWQAQLDEALSSAMRSGDTRFYYSGLVQAALLERLTSDWKPRVLTTHLALEDLLRELTPLQP